MRSMCLLLASSCLAATTARADFVVRNATNPTAPANAVASDPAAPPAASQAGDTADGPAQPSPAPVKFKMAYGFGDQVPLGFACRQIVPRAVKVTYGPGASPRQIVSWKGGDTWNHVLQDAVKPIRLHLVMTHMAVEIRG